MTSRIGERRLSALWRRTAEVTAYQGHSNLAEGLWLSVDPGGEARLSLGPKGDGFRITLRNRDSARWADFGCRLPREEYTALAQGKYLNVRIRGEGEGLTLFGVFLRHVRKPGGTVDISSENGVLSPGGRVECDLRIPLDHDLIGKADELELVLAFYHDRMDMSFETFELSVTN
ncbi:hypothetical protein RXV86_21750 [Alisedimentitalea sp. MJ-SS2]|uniref:hypothetical protein n=1 Tax=Aliisedimentitalea sp. MJ-SS2 TaxID=3049795 RepID=UPI00291309C8|nr:hypothetical protein [Alisedimentitalea sp. MJ-SS2]MDU8930019.1 hypothetical protein [Alisedimentitalea sp. MJ-SS2]